MLEADNLECVRGERRLFAGLGFKLEAGELLYLQGRNGSGKTSLLRMLIGLLPPEAGEIRWNGEPIKRLADEFRADLCYLGHLNAIKEELTPLENLLAAARLADEEISEDDAIDALEQVGLAGREDLACKYLSQGQKRRVALARLVKEIAPAVDTRRTFRGARCCCGRLAGRHHFRAPATRRHGGDDDPPAGEHPGRHRARIAARLMEIR